MKRTARFLATAAIIAALYAALTLLLAPLSYGMLQVRFSEALCILPVFTPAAVPGLFVGCLLANGIGMTLGLTTVLDVVCGSLATLAAAYLGRRLKKRPWLVPLPSVLVNAVVVGWVIVQATGSPLAAWLPTGLYVAAGQAVACYVAGMPLYYALRAARLFDAR